MKTTKLCWYTEIHEDLSLTQPCLWTEHICFSEYAFPESSRDSWTLPILHSPLPPSLAACLHQRCYCCRHFHLPWHHLAWAFCNKQNKITSNKQVTVLRKSSNINTSKINIPKTTGIRSTLSGAPVPIVYVIIFRSLHFVQCDVRRSGSAELGSWVFAFQTQAGSVECGEVRDGGCRRVDVEAGFTVSHRTSVCQNIITVIYFYKNLRAQSIIHENIMR